MKNKKQTQSAEYYQVNELSKTVKLKSIAMLDRNSYTHLDSWFSVIYKRLNKEMYYYTKKYIFNISDVEDVVSQGFTKLYYKLSESKDMNFEDAKFFLMSILHNLSVDYVRKNRAQKRDIQLKINQADMIDNSGNSLFFNLLDKENSHNLNGEQILIYSEAKGFIYSALNKIKSNNAKIALTMWLKGYTIQEIVNHLNDTNNNNDANCINVKTMLSRYKAQLRINLKAII